MRKVRFMLCILCLVAVSGNLAAKERHGVDTIVTLTTGREVRGELIAVKKDSLVLLTSSSGMDASIEISDMRSIKIATKSNAVNGTIIGTLVGGGAGALLGSMIGKYRGGWFDFSTAFTVGGAAAGVVVGGVGGLLIGSHTKEWETFIIEKQPPGRINTILDKLRPKARVPDFRCLRSTHAC